MYTLANALVAIGVLYRLIILSFSHARIVNVMYWRSRADSLPGMPPYLSSSTASDTRSKCSQHLAAISCWIARIFRRCTRPLAVWKWICLAVGGDVSKSLMSVTRLATMNLTCETWSAGSLLRPFSPQSQSL